MEEDVESMGQAFGLLKPICDSVVTTPTKENAIALKNALHAVPNVALRRLQSVVLFPIELHLFNKYCLSTEVIRYLVDALSELLTLTYTASIDQFTKTYVILFKQITVDDNPTELAAVSEELKLSVVNCVQALFSTAFSDVLDRFYEKKYHPKLSFGVFVCTRIVALERMVTLRVSSLKCLLHMCQVNDDADETDIVFRYKVGNIVMLIMPGVVFTALSVVSGGDLQNHHVTLMGLRLWGRLIALVMDDKCSVDNCEQEQQMYNDCRTQYGFSIPKISNNNVGEKCETTKCRTKEWFTKASKELEKVNMKIVEAAQNHTNFKVRLELAKSIDLILTSCPWNLQNSLKYLIETLIILCHDTVECVSVYSNEVLEKFTQKYSSNMGKCYLELIEENFYMLMLKFPRLIVNFENHTEMTLLNGYLNILGPQLPKVLSSDQHLSSLIRCLTQVMQLDTNSVSLLAGHSLRDMEDGNMLGNRQFKQFLYSPNRGALLMGQLEQICETLRNYADLPMLVYTLLDLLRQLENHREIMLILTTLLTSVRPGSMRDRADLIREVFNVYMDMPIWPASEILGDPFHEEQGRVLQLCLAIESLGKMSCAVGKFIFGPWLLHCLYAILEAAGSPLEVVAVAGLKAVQRISDVCAGGSITQLVCSNTDYLTHQIVRRLRQLRRHPGLLSVLSVIMRNSSREVLPSLQEIFSDVLRQSYDVYQVNSVYSYARAFFTFICSVRRWEEDEAMETGVAEEKDEQNINKSPVEILLEYKLSKEIVENLDGDLGNEADTRTTEEKFADECKRFRDDQNNLEDTGGEEEGESKKKEVPIHIQLVVDILRRSLNFLPSKDGAQQILVMQVLEEGVLLLRRYPDQLLPVVHLIWSPLVNRFKSASTEPLIMHRAFLLLNTLASTSKDFIRHRTLKDVLPSICRVLQNTCNESLLKDTNSAYRLTQQYKMQKCLLEGLGPLTIDLDLSSKNVSVILDASTPYLSCLQPQPLQTACIGLFKTLADASKDLVWLHLLNIWTPEPVLRPKSSCLDVVELPAVPEDSEYKRNVQVLFKTIDF